jgi:hypothetical protein
MNIVDGEFRSKTLNSSRKKHFQKKYKKKTKEWFTIPTYLMNINGQMDFLRDSMMSALSKQLVLLTSVRRISYIHITLQFILDTL